MQKTQLKALAFFQAYEKPANLTLLSRICDDSDLLYNTYVLYVFRAISFDQGDSDKWSNKFK